MHPSLDIPEKRSRNGPIAAIVLFVVLVVYPLSTGPAQTLVSHGLLSPEGAIMTAYAPLQWVYLYLPDKAQRALDRYDQLWGEWPQQH